MCAHVIVLNVLNMLNVLDVLDVLNVGVHLRITEHEKSVVLRRRDGPGKQRSCLSHAFAAATVHQSMQHVSCGGCRKIHLVASKQRSCLSHAPSHGSMQKHRTGR